ncbi:hypothetical protein Tco_1285247 [Tanacetum coccineum]
MIGGLMYLTASRPDIAFATFVCARYQARQNIKKPLKDVQKRIFRYLRHNHSMGYRYSKDYGFELIAYADADHAGCNDDCKSTSGGIQFLRDKLVSWSSKSKIVQLCQSADAAYVISRLLCYQVISDANSNYWTKDFYYHKISTYYDSKSALPIMQSVQHSRTKHINIRYHFIKEHVEKVQLNYTLSGRNTSLLIYSQKPFRRKGLSFLVTDWYAMYDPTQ